MLFQHLNNFNWKEKGKTISVRINGLRYSLYVSRDIINITGAVLVIKLTLVLVPKVGSSSDVYMVDCLLTQIEIHLKNLKIKSELNV